MQMKYPVYAPTPLNSMKAICEFFDVGDKTVKSWFNQGAPIRRSGEGTATAWRSEGVALSFWLNNEHEIFEGEA